VFEKRVLRRIFGPKRDEETGGWRKLHNEELHKILTYFILSLYSFSLKPRGMHTGFWFESQKERVHWEDLDIRWEVNIILNLR
jgi:hypothetical protein